MGLRDSGIESSLLVQSLKDLSSIETSLCILDLIFVHLSDNDNLHDASARFQSQIRDLFDRATCTLVGLARGILPLLDFRADDRKSLLTFDLGENPDDPAIHTGAAEFGDELKTLT